MGICGNKSESRELNYLDEKLAQRCKIRKTVKIEENKNSKLNQHFVTGDKFLNINDAEIIDDILNIYTFREKAIGRGSFGTVLAAKLRFHGKDFDTNPSTAYAIKVINMTTPGIDETMLNNEISMLKNCSHPNIINLYEIYTDSERLYLVMELCPGGDIDEYLKLNKVVREDNARQIFYQMLYAVNFLHSSNIAHRDIKPGNFMFSDESKNTVKLIDFGWSAEYSENDMLSIAGSAYYVAPEIGNNFLNKYKKKYDNHIDVWSLGVTLYEILSNKMPFYGKDHSDVFRNINTKRVQFTDDVWFKISDDCKELITLLLVKNPKQRISVAEAMNHKWFYPLQNVLILQKANLINKCKVDNLMNFKAYSLFDKEILRIMVETNYDSPKVVELSNVFWYLDYDNDGYISANEIHAFLKEVGENVTFEKAEQITKDISYSSLEDTISHIEFVMATISRSFYYNDQNIASVFKRFDVNNTNKIGLNDLIQGFIRYGFLPKQINALKKELASMKDKTLTLEAFVQKIKSDGIDKRESGATKIDVNDWDRYELDLNRSTLIKKADRNVVKWTADSKEHHELQHKSIFDKTN